MCVFVHAYFIGYRTVLLDIVIGSLSIKNRDNMFYYNLKSVFDCSDQLLKMNCLLVVKNGNYTIRVCGLVI